MFVYLVYIPILIILITLGLFIFFKNRKSATNITFSLHVFAIAIWVFTLIFADSVKNYDQAFFWNQVAMVGPAFIPYLFVIFVINYINDYKPSKIILLLLFIPNLIVLAFIPTKYNVKEIIVQNWGAEVTPGGLYIFFLGYIILYMGAGLYLLIRKYRKVSGIMKMQIRYIFSGILLGTILGVCTNLIFLFYGISNFSILAPLAGLIMSICISYAILKYQLMDIRVIIQKGLVYSMLFGSVFIFYSLVVRIITELLENAIVATSVISVLISSLFIVLTFKPVEKFFQKVTNKIFFKQEYDYSETLSELGKTVNEIIKIKPLLEQVVNTLSRSLQVKDIKILLKDSKKNKFFVKGSCLNNKKIRSCKIDANGRIAKELIHTKKPIIKDLFKININNKDDNTVQNHKKILEKLEKCNSDITLPVIFQNKLIGIISLGVKLSGDSYSDKDIDLLSIFSNQLAIAINNAWLFENLELKVKERTSDLNKALSELKQMDKAKTEFLSIASHQLRTPLTAIKGILDMTRSGDFGELKDKQKKYIDKAFDSNERLIKLVNDLLNISRIEMGRIKLKIQQFEIDAMIKSVMQELSGHANEKKLSLIFKKKASEKYLVDADPEQIRQVIVNLIDNAIKYTKTGKIIAQIRDLKKDVIVEISDTGRGIKNADLKYIFKKYTRAKYEVKKFIGGEGLGLHIVKKIVEAHGGKVWAESDGLDKGSKFYFKLPKK